MPDLNIFVNEHGFEHGNLLVIQAQAGTLDLFNMTRNIPRGHAMQLSCRYYVKTMLQHRFVVIMTLLYLVSTRLYCSVMYNFDFYGYRLGSR